MGYCNFLRHVRPTQFSQFGCRSIQNGSGRGPGQSWREWVKIWRFLGLSHPGREGSKTRISKSGVKILPCARICKADLALCVLAALVIWVISWKVHGVMYCSSSWWLTPHYCGICMSVIQHYLHQPCWVLENITILICNIVMLASSWLQRLKHLTKLCFSCGNVFTML